LQGNKLSGGFWSGFASSVLSVGTKDYGGVTGRTMIMAVVGGTVSELTGGKFANGAVGGAFVHLFNAKASFRNKMIKMLGLEKVKDIADRAAKIAKKYKLTGVHNGQLDAVRHCVGICMVAREVGYWKAAIAGDAHEFYDNSLSSETIMDLYNNEIGLELSWLSDQSCGDACFSALQDGYLMESPPW
jgi:hypothetical protein